MPKWWILLVGVVLAACTAVPKPTPTPQIVIRETVVEERPSPSPTQTFITPIAKPSATASSNLVWTPTVKVLTTIDASFVHWSPTSDEFIFTNCYGHPGETTNVKLTKATSPNFNPSNITPTNVPLESICANGFGLVWTPGGDQILFAGGNHEYILYGDLWIMDKDGLRPHLFNQDATTDIWLPSQVGWHNEESFIFTEYTGGGTQIGHTVNINSSETTTLNHVWGGYLQKGQNYIALTFNAPIISEPEMVTQDTVAVTNIPFSEEIPPNSITRGWATGIYWLSFDFGSNFEDWLPNTDTMLVVTWEDEGPLDPSKRTDLQLWHVDSGELSLIVSDGWSGRFSPDGRLLAYYTLQPTPMLNLMEMESNHILASLPSSELPKYGLSGKELFAWSPTNEMLVYFDERENWTLFDISSRQQIPLTETGGERLSNPQWSYDGRYLSFSVLDENEGVTAVILVPQP